MSDNDRGIESPWKAFLTALDKKLTEPVCLHCLGGFAMIVQYGLERPTNDIDYFTLVPTSATERLHELAGENSELDKQFGLHLHSASISTLPDSYEDRLIEVFPQLFEKLRIYVLDPYDLVLSKLERNIDRDREDVRFLAKNLKLDPKILQERYAKEFRPICIGPPERHDLTMELWTEEYFSLD